MRYRVDISTKTSSMTIWRGWSLETALKHRAAWKHLGYEAHIYKTTVRVTW